jgi:hypothetical protein
MSDETEIPEEVAAAAVSLLIIPSIVITFSLIVPLTGILVRFRANYNPKGLQLDAEGAATPHTGPVITSYFSMFRRVWRLEVCARCSCYKRSHLYVRVLAGMGWAVQGFQCVVLLSAVLSG